MSEDEEDHQTDRVEPTNETATACDRRLSRAARELLKREASAILRRHVSPVAARRGSSSLVELWTLLEQSVATRGSTCLLDPHVDVWREDELHSRPPTATGPRNAPPGKYAQRETLYTSEYSGKTFHTRYYLDRHMDRRQAGGQGGANDAGHGMVCPAEAWCSTLFTREDCVRTALEQEPFYGRGSSDASSQRGRMARDHHRRQYWQLAAEPCREEAMIQQRQRCSQVLQDCFPARSDLRMDLETHFCERITCHWRLQRMAFAFFAARSNVDLAQFHVHHWYDAWHDEQAHRSTWIALVLVVLLVFYGLRLGEWALARWTRLLQPLLVLWDQGARKRRPNSAAFWRKPEEPQRRSGGAVHTNGLRRRRRADVGEQ